MKILNEQPQNTNGTTEERSESHTQKNAASLSVKKKSLKPGTVTPRRSSRLQSLIQPSEDVEVDAGVEHIDLVESEMDDGTDLDKAERELEPFVEEAEPIPDGRSLEERVDQLVADVELLKHKVLN